MDSSCSPFFNNLESLKSKCRGFISAFLWECSLDSLQSPPPAFLCDGDHLRYLSWQSMCCFLAFLLLLPPHHSPLISSVCGFLSFHLATQMALLVAEHIVFIFCLLFLSSLWRSVTLVWHLSQHLLLSGNAGSGSQHYMFPSAAWEGVVSFKLLVFVEYALFVKHLSDHGCSVSFVENRTLQIHAEVGRFLVCSCEVKH